jgi:hypothetical protein
VILEVVHGHPLPYAHAWNAGRITEAEEELRRRFGRNQVQEVRVEFVELDLALTRIAFHHEDGVVGGGVGVGVNRLLNGWMDGWMG